VSLINECGAAVFNECGAAVFEAIADTKGDSSAALVDDFDQPQP
jgi:hypothetical protein